MGTIWNRLFKVLGHNDEDSDIDTSLSESDSTDIDLTDENVENKIETKIPKKKKKKVKKDEPTDGWEEICVMDVDVLEDVMLTKKHKITHSDKNISEKSIKVPTTEENRERLSSAYNLWLKYRPDDCQVFMPRWERILEKPVLEQSVLVDEYVRKVFYLLKLEEIPEYNLPDDISKGEVLIRDPNKPGVFIKLKDALEERKKLSKKRHIDSCKELFSKMHSSSGSTGVESYPNLKLLNRINSRHTV